MIQRTVEKDDLLTRIRIREVTLFCLIALTAAFANLPAETIEELGINHDYLSPRWAPRGDRPVPVPQVLLLLSIVLLILGANLPDHVAERFNVSKIPLILALVALIGMSLINAVVKLLPTGLEPRPKEKSPEGVRALFYAIEKNNVVYGQKVLSMNFDTNLQHENGYTPLAFAAMKGNPQMVELFLRNGADPSLTTKEGDTPVELALRMGHNEVADLLKHARQELDARRAAAAEAPPPARV